MAKLTVQHELELTSIRSIYQEKWKQGLVSTFFNLPQILLGMSLWTPFLLIDGVCLLDNLVMRRLGFGLFGDCVFVFPDKGVPVMFLAFGNLHKRRDRTIQRVGNGTEQFGFAFLDQIVSADDLHAGFE